MNSKMKNIMIFYLGKNFSIGMLISFNNRLLKFVIFAFYQKISG